MHNVQQRDRAPCTCWVIAKTYWECERQFPLLVEGGDTVVTKLLSMTELAGF
jgi:hypothetical protein